MNILLLEPPPAWKYGNQRSKGAFGNLKTDIRWPSIDLLVVAGLLRKHGIMPSLIDANSERLTKNQLCKRLNEIPTPSIVIVNTSTTTIYNDYETIVLVKEMFPESRIGAIGVHVMALPEETLNECNELDFVIYSEQDFTILNLVKNNGVFKSTKGIYYRENNKIHKTKPEPPVSNMDDLGIPAHDLVDYSLFSEPQMKRQPMTITMVSRGCVNKCTFCSSHFYNSYRVRSTENVMKELRWITKDLGIKELKFYDDGITYNRDWAKELFTKMIDENIDLTWNTNLRADSIDYELACLMKKAGCHTVNMGLESANTTILKNICKNSDTEVFTKAIDYCKKAGLEVCGYFVFGFPGETLDTIEETRRFVKTLDLDLVTFNIATPHPGTPFYTYLIDNNYLRTKDWSQFDTNSVAVFDYPNITGKEIYKAALDSYRIIYMRPSYILKRIRRIESFSELMNMIKNFIAFFKNFIIKSIMTK